MASMRGLRDIGEDFPQFVLPLVGRNRLVPPIVGGTHQGRVIRVGHVASVFTTACLAYRRTARRRTASSMRRLGTAADVEVPV